MTNDIKKRKELTIVEKVELIKNSEGKNQRALANIYGIGKTQVQSILKRRCELLKAYEENTCVNRKRIKSSLSQFQQDVNMLTYSWFQKVKFHLPISGPFIQQNALDFANAIGHERFRASNGWLERFKKRHNIKLATKCEKKDPVDFDDVTYWKTKLAQIASRFQPQDIFMMDDTDIFCSELAAQPSACNDKEHNDGKKSNEKLKVCFCVSMNGHFENIIVIGKHAKLKIFTDSTFSSLPIIWTHSKNASMSSEILSDWLQCFNTKMMKDERRVLLLLSNSVDHLKNVALTNLKVVFLPSNVNSILQPLHQGIFEEIKTNYTKILLETACSKRNKGENISDLYKCVSVFDVMYWLASAVDEVSPKTVLSCFNQVGIMQIDTPPDAHTVDNDNRPSKELDNENIKQHILEDYFQRKNETICKNDDCDVNTAESTALTSQITTFSSALQCVGQLRLFLLNKNASHLNNLLDDIENELCEMSADSSKQSSIQEYFVSV